ncbi:MAG: hypothetical protein ACYTEZ_11635 [Planctomycetota bacterium]
MRIAIIGWGSLIWDKRRLPPGGSWSKGGPTLPIAFSQGPRPNLVVDGARGRETSTHYALSHRTSLADAIADFCDRDDASLQSVGFVSPTKISREEGPERAVVFDRIRTWCGQAGFDAAVWRWRNEPAITFH